MNVKQANQLPSHYEVDLSGVKTNQVKVVMTLNLPGNSPVDVALSVVGPGAPDNNMNYAERLTGLQVADASGKTLNHKKLLSGGWRINRKNRTNSGPIKVSYLINANEYDFTRSQFNRDHAYLNGAQTFLFVKEHDRDLPAVVQFTHIPNKHWKSISSLWQVRGKEHAYYAPSFQDLADSNIELGRFKQIKRYVNGSEIVIAQHGKPPYKYLLTGGVSLKQNMNDFAKIWSVFEKEFGPFPAQRYLNAPRIPSWVDPKKRYVIMKHYVKEHHGAVGLEHYRGHELQFMQRHEYRIHQTYKDNPRFLENHVMAHELGHRLLAKFVLHKGIDTSNFMRGQITDGLWFTEGVTDWIEPYLVRRANLISPEDYLHFLQQNVNQYRLDFLANPTNAREDSMDAQMGRAGYYNKGKLLGTMLDLEIRNQTNGEKSFADVLRLVKERFGGTGKPHTLSDIRQAAEKVAGKSLRGFFADYLNGHKPIDFNHYLAYAGYRLEERKDNWELAEIRLPHVILKSDRSGQLTLKPEQGLKNPKEFPMQFFPSLGLQLEKKEDGNLVIAKQIVDATSLGLRPDGAAFKDGLRNMVGKSLESLLIEVKVSNKKIVLEIPLGKEKQVDPDSLADFLKAHQKEGHPLKVTKVGFKISMENKFGGPKKDKVGWVSPRPLTKVVLEEIPSATERQLKVRANWLLVDENQQKVETEQLDHNF